MLNLLKKCCFGLSIFLCFILNNISFAANNSPLFACKFIDSIGSDGSPGKTVDSYYTYTAVLFLYCYSDQAQAGQKVKAVWIADDTNNVTPPNYVMNSKEMQLTQDNSWGGGYTAVFAVSKPVNGLPSGNYHVDVYVDGKLDQSLKFTVKQ